MDRSRHTSPSPVDLKSNNQMESPTLTGFGRIEDNPSRLVPKWRNWQTHQIQGLAPARVSGFKSRLRHQNFFP